MKFHKENKDYMYMCFDWKVVLNNYICLHFYLFLLFYYGGPMVA